MSDRPERPDDWRLTPYKPNPNDRAQYIEVLVVLQDLQADVCKRAVAENWGRAETIKVLAILALAGQTFDDANFPEFTKAQASVVLSGVLLLVRPLSNPDRKVAAVIDDAGVVTVHANSTPEGLTAFTLVQLIHFYMYPYYKPEDVDEPFPTFESLTSGS